MKCKKLLFSVTAFCLTAATSHATLILYTFDEDIPFGSDLGVGSPVSFNGFASAGITASNWTAVSPERDIGIVDGQVRALKSPDADTHTFIITIPDLGGAILNLTSLSFTFGEVGPDDGAPTWTVTSNLVGGTITPNTANADGTQDSITAFANMALGGTFSNLSPNSPTIIIFTLEDAAQGNNKSSSMYTWISDVALTGTLIPEPSAALLGGLGALLVLRRRR